MQNNAKNALKQMCCDLMMQKIIIITRKKNNQNYLPLFQSKFNMVIRFFSSDLPVMDVNIGNGL